jgi:hypothetical protein
MKSIAVLVFGLAVVSAQSAPGVRVDDFEDGDRRARSGLSWISISDDLMGGVSTARLSIINQGAGGSRHALKVTGEIGGSPAFAGAWVALDGRGRATDLSDFSGIRLRVRSSGKLRLSLRGGALPGGNFAASIEPSSEWKAVEVPFEMLKAVGPQSATFDPKLVRWLGVLTAAEPPASYEFEIDDVELVATKSGATPRESPEPTMAVLFKEGRQSDLPRGPWQDVAKDPAADGTQKRLPEATALSIARDDRHDRVWFRISLGQALPDRWFGANLALDTDGDPKNGMAWWGTNKAFHFDTVVTVWGSEAGDEYEGMLGITTAAAAQSGIFHGPGSDRLVFVVDRQSPSMTIGVPRDLLGAGAHDIRVVAAIGSAMQHNDDVPDEGGALVPRSAIRGPHSAVREPRSANRNPLR